MNTAHAINMSMLRNAAVPPAAIASAKNEIGLRMFPPAAIHANAYGQVDSSAAKPANRYSACRMFVDLEITGFTTTSPTVGDANVDIGVEVADDELTRQSRLVVGFVEVGKQVGFLLGRFDEEVVVFGR